VAAKDAGLKADGDVLEVQLLAAAYRRPLEIEVTRAPGKATFRTSNPARIRVSYRVLCADWPKDAKPVLTGRRGDGAGEIVRDSTVGEGTVEWQADRGEYELVPGDGRP
jgi:hypothetical protein